MASTVSTNGKMAGATLAPQAAGLVDLPAYIAAPPVAEVTVDSDVDTTSPMVAVTVRFTDIANSDSRARRAFNAVSRVQPPANGRPNSGAVVSFTVTRNAGKPDSTQETFNDVPFVVLATDTHNESPELWSVKLRMTFIDPATGKPYAREASVNARAFTALTVMRRNPHYLPPAWAGHTAIGRDTAPEA